MKKIREYLTYLGVFIFFLYYLYGYLFLQNRSLNKSIRLITSKHLILIIFLLIFFEFGLLIMNLFRDKSKKINEKLLDNKNIILFYSLSAIMIGIIHVLVKDTSITKMLIIAFFSKNIGFDKTSKTIAVSVITFAILWMMFYALGMLNIQEFGNRGNSLGMYYYNGTGFCLLVITLVLYYFFLNKHLIIYTVYTIFLFVFSLSIFVSRSYLVSIVLLYIFNLIFYKKPNIIDNKFINKIIIYLPFIIFCISVLISVVTYLTNGLINFGTFGARFINFFTQLKYSGIHLGYTDANNIILEDGSKIYIHTDNNYYYLLLSYGLVYFLIFMFITIKSNKQITLNKDLVLINVMSVCYIYGFMELIISLPIMFISVSYLLNYKMLNMYY